MTATGSATAAASATLTASTSKSLGCQSSGSQLRPWSAIGESLREQVVVVAAAHPCRELLVAPESAAVLGRARHSAGGAANGRRRLVEDLVDHEPVVPAVSEVVLVPERVALVAQELVEPYVVLQHPLVALREVDVRDEVRRAVVSPGAEPMEVRIGPAHRDLDDVMQLGQRQVARQLETPPDRGPRAVQVQPDPEAARLRRHREQLRRLVQLQPLEDAGDLPAHQRIEEGPALFRADPGHQLPDEGLVVGRSCHERQSITAARPVDGGGRYPGAPEAPMSPEMVEPRGLEPLTPCLQSRCATNCAKAPGWCRRWCRHGVRRTPARSGPLDRVGRLGPERLLLLALVELALGEHGGAGAGARGTGSSSWWLPRWRATGLPGWWA